MLNIHVLNLNDITLKIQALRRIYRIAYDPTHISQVVALQFSTDSYILRNHAGTVTSKQMQIFFMMLECVLLYAE